MKLGQGHENLISSYACHNDISMQVWRKSIHWPRRYSTYKIMVTKIFSNLKLALMIYLCQFDKNPSTGSKDILLTRLWPWKWGQGHQNLISHLACPNNIMMQCWRKSIRWFRRYSEPAEPDIELCVWGTKAELRARVGRPQTSWSPPVIFIAGRPKAALLFWFFGDFRCGALLFMVIHVIYKYKNK